MVPNTLILAVWASSPQAQVIVSKVKPEGSVVPPKPFQRATGTMHSIPTFSESCASLRLFSQLASHRSGTLTNATPPEQLDPNSPILNAFPPTILGLRWDIHDPRIMDFPHFGMFSIPLR